MRSTLENVFDFKDLIELKTGQFDNYLRKARIDEIKRLEDSIEQLKLHGHQAPKASAKRIREDQEKLRKLQAAQNNAK
jgi:hypothetical protein